MFSYDEAQAFLIKCLIDLKNRILERNNWHLGDTIVCSFHYDQIRDKQKYSYSKEAQGILKEDKNGVLYCESLDEFPFYTKEDNGLSGRSNREWYRCNHRKSIRVFNFSTYYDTTLSD